jgi:hypothetical protein
MEKSGNTSAASPSQAFRAGLQDDLGKARARLGEWPGLPLYLSLSRPISVKLRSRIALTTLLIPVGAGGCG